jgi:hypothetical protein
VGDVRPTGGPVKGKTIASSVASNFSSILIVADLSTIGNWFGINLVQIEARV